MSRQDTSAEIIQAIASNASYKGAHAPRFRRAGSFVFVSGIGPDRGSLLADIRGQTAACIEALGGVLEDAGGGLENLVEIVCYLANMNVYGGYNEAYSKFFTVDGPARTTVSVDQLTHPDALIEMRGTAYIAENTNAQV